MLTSCSLFFNKVIIVLFKPLSDNSNILIIRGSASIVLFFCCLSVNIIYFFAWLVIFKFFSRYYIQNNSSHSRRCCLITESVPPFLCWAEKVRLWSTQFSQKLSGVTARLQFSENHLLSGLPLLLGHGPLTFWLKAWRIYLLSTERLRDPNLPCIDSSLIPHVSSKYGRYLKGPSGCVVRSMAIPAVLASRAQDCENIILPLRIFHLSSPVFHTEPRKCPMGKSSGAFMSLWVSILSHQLLMTAAVLLISFPPIESLCLGKSSS